MNLFIAIILVYMSGLHWCLYPTSVVVWGLSYWIDATITCGFRRATLSNWTEENPEILDAAAQRAWDKFIALPVSACLCSCSVCGDCEVSEDGGGISCDPSCN